MLYRENPPLKGEGRTAEGSPGWGGGRAIETPRPDLRHGRHPHPARLRGPTSPLQPNLAIARVRPLNKVTEVGNSRLRLGEGSRKGEAARAAGTEACVQRID